MDYHYRLGFLIPILTLTAVSATSCNENTPDLSDGLYADFDTTKGRIIVELFPEKAPLTVTNFVGLAEGSLEFAEKKGPFYDGIVFHRVIEDFMIQGGDPRGNGTGGPGYSFPDETDNIFMFDSPGVLAMANAGPDTNGSQFFITRVPTPHLNGRHTIFGSVVQGQDVVEAIRQGDAINKLKILRIGTEAKNYTTDAESFRELERNLIAQRKIAREEELRAIKEDIDRRWPNAVRDEKTGVYSLIRTEGAGKTPAPGTLITVHYTGTLMDGTQFDSSRDRGEPFRFMVGQGQVIPGWDVSFLTMKKGERRIIIIPPEMAYGEQGIGPIPPNSWLAFDVEILDFGEAE